MRSYLNTDTSYYIHILWEVCRSGFLFLATLYKRINESRTKVRRIFVLFLGRIKYDKLLNDYCTEWHDANVVVHIAHFAGLFVHSFLPRPPPPPQPILGASYSDRWTKPNQPTDRPTDQSTNQPTNQPTDQPTNRPTNQQHKQLNYHFAFGGGGGGEERGGHIATWSNLPICILFFLSTFASQITSFENIPLKRTNVSYVIINI